MKYKIGDQVVLLNDNLEGTITSLHGEEIVLKDEHGFTHKIKRDEILKKDGSIYENIQPINKSAPPKLVSKKHSKNKLILDLHFEKLVDKPSQYESFERLMLQREKLIETVEYCRQNHIKKLQIIHGIGDGTLQKMVFEYLHSQHNIDFHQDEILAEQSASVLVYLL